MDPPVLPILRTLLDHKVKHEESVPAVPAPGK